MKKEFKNIKKIYIGDGKNNKLKRNLFDIVHSNATLEHIGSFQNQISFIKDCIIISKKYVFIQTPNKFYLMEMHTLIPFIHWLPNKIYRKILKLLRLNFYSLEKKTYYQKVI